MSFAGETRLIIQLSQLSPTFEGTPQEFAAHIVERLKILSPFGIETFVVGDTAPSSNEGPWLKNGTQWYVWDANTSTYIPADISASESHQIVISSTQPSDFSIPFWAKFTGSGINSKFVNFYYSTGVSYVPLLNLINSGGTTARPSSPSDYEQYYDTDIQALIWWERSKWRTVSGVPGDIKHVTGVALLDILTKNPGWQEIGSLNSGYRARTIISATRDGAGGPSVFTPPAGLTLKAVGDIAGEETHQLLTAELPSHYHGQNTNAISTQTPAVISAVAGTATGGKIASTAGSNLQQVTTDAVGSGTAHNNIQPSVNFWCLYKE